MPRSLELVRAKKEAALLPPHPLERGEKGDHYHLSFILRLLLLV